MKRIFRYENAKKKARGATALVLAGTMAASCVPAMAAEKIDSGVHATYDEAYYATLDYYGNLAEGSVVKSYTMNGATAITDYGTYDEVVNLTDSTAPKRDDEKTSFTFDKSPSHFYFEGQTSAPFAAMPWTLSVSYDLNGVPAKAEDLAGAKGVVDIHINAVPNKSASDYAKNNYTLEAMAAFNQDDILSLTADGGQVQLLGNLRVVMFAVLPGEEQHFTISVGSNDFSFGGLTFLLAPATLSQLSSIKELKDKEAKIEDSYDELNSSIDTLLNSLSNMSGSLSATADGLDKLNEARGDISGGAGEVYDSADKVLGDLDGLNDSLGKASGHLDTAEKAADDVTTSLNSVNKTVQSLRDDIYNVERNMDAIQTDLNSIKALAGTSNSSGMRKDLVTLGTDIAALQTNLAGLRPLLAELKLGVGTGGSAQELSVQGMTMSQINEALEKAESLEKLYYGVGGGDELSFTEFMIAAQMAQGTSQADAAANAQKLYTVYTSFPSAAYAQAAETSDPTTYAGVTEAYAKAQLFAAIYESAVQPASGESSVSLSDTMNECEFAAAMLMLNDYQSGVAAGGDSAAVLGTITAAAPTYYTSGTSLVTLYDKSKTGLLANMTSLCDTLGTNGLTGDLTSLSALTAATAGDMSTLIDLGDSVLTKADTLITEANTLNSQINKYAPELKSALEDTKTLIGSVTTTVSDTHSFLSAFEALVKKSGYKLDSGTQETLTGLSATLRQASRSMNSVNGVKSAKKNITSLIDNTWNEYTGKQSNLLNMDPDAETQSLTSGQNAAPTSVQMLMRTQEIKSAGHADSDSSPSAASDNGTFGSRFLQMFKDIWHDFTHLI